MSDFNRWTYFVAYSHPRGHGMVEITSNREADNMEEVKKFCRTISDLSGIPAQDIVIINFQLLRKT
jgi:hypothetical protein